MQLAEYMTLAAIACLCRQTAVHTLQSRCVDDGNSILSRICRENLPYSIGGQTSCRCISGHRLESRIGDTVVRIEIPRCNFDELPDMSEEQHALDLTFRRAVKHEADEVARLDECSPRQAAGTGEILANLSWHEDVRGKACRDSDIYLWYQGILEALF